MCTSYVSGDKLRKAKNPCESVVPLYDPVGAYAHTDASAIGAPPVASTTVPRMLPVTPPAANAGRTKAVCSRHMQSSASRMVQKMRCLRVVLIVDPPVARKSRYGVSRKMAVTHVNASGRAALPHKFLSLGGLPCFAQPAPACFCWIGVDPTVSYHRY